MGVGPVECDCFGAWGALIFFGVLALVFILVIALDGIYKKY